MKKIGKYEVLGELGHGAMGVVYRARDPIINRLVALKTITSGLADDPNLLERFYREARSAGGLQHPNIVTIYDMGDENNLPYIAMELIEGESLEQSIARRTNLPVALKLTYALQACRAFDYAHKRGIIHRDIKPGNVMVGRESVAKVVDFGIARVLDTSKTQTGMLIGTFAYMSPEQYHGEHADERSDIWSFGVLLYELLSYQKPFTGHNPASLMHSICQEEPRPLLQVVPDCPRELEVIISRILRKSPGDRWQSMEDVLLELEPVSKELQSRSIAELVDRSRQLVEEGDFRQANELLREALKVDRANASARSLLEKVNAEIKRKLVRPKAQQHIEKGLSLLEEGRIQEARAEAESALQLDSSFEPAQELQKLVQQELDRAQLIAECLQGSGQRIAEGMPDDAELLLKKVLELDPANKQALALQEQVQNEKAERQRRLWLLEKMQEARVLWTQQRYEQSIEILTALQNEFPSEEDIQRLLETVREDQSEQCCQRALESVRNCLAEGSYAECRAALFELQKQFPNDEEIVRLAEEVRLDEAKQRRLKGLAEARTLLASGRYQDSIALLINLQAEFSEDQEISRVLSRAREEQAEEQRQKGILQVRSLLAARQYEECIAGLTELRNQFPEDEEISGLHEVVRQRQSEQRKLNSLTEARTYLASGKYQDSIGVLLKLQKEFPGDAEVSPLLARAREEEAEKQKEQEMDDARSLLAAKRYKECNAALAKLRKQFPDDKKISQLLDAVREGEAEQRKLKNLGEARNLLASKQYKATFALIGALSKEFPGDEDITILLQAAREAQAEDERQQGMEDARNLLAARRYDACDARLAKLRKQFPADKEILQLQDAVRSDQAEQHKLKVSGEARALLAGRQYEQAIALLVALGKEFPDDEEIRRQLATAQEGQAEQRKIKVLAEARSFLASKRFEEAATSVTPLQNEFPNDSEIPRLLTKIQREHTEHKKQQKLAEARALAISQRFEDALEVIDGLLARFPKDTGIEKLRANIEHDREKQSRKDRLQRELDDLKKIISEKKYAEVLFRAEGLLADFPGNIDLVRLLDFARSQQSQIEREALLRSTINEIKAHARSNRFTEAIAAAKDGLKAFPQNAELLYILEQTEAQQEKERTRRLIEQAVREIRYKINRSDLSEAIDLAKRTLAAAGPDTELSQLLSSALVELRAREKKREAERKLEEVRTLMNSGDLDAAEQTLVGAVTAEILDGLDPHVSRISQEIAVGRTAIKAPSSTPAAAPPVNSSKEYAFLGPAPEVEEPPSEQRAPSEQPAPQAGTAQSLTPPKLAESPPALASTEPAISALAPIMNQTVILPAALPPDVSAAPGQTPEQRVPEHARRAQASRTVRGVAIPKLLATLTELYKNRVVALGALVVGATIAIGLTLHFWPSKTTPKSTSVAATSPGPILKPTPAPGEVQQRAALDKAEQLIVGNDWNAALAVLQEADKLNGPLTEQIKVKEETVRESLNNAALRKTRQEEALLWQRATVEVNRAEFGAAKRDFRKILNYQDGGVRKTDARKYLEEVIPQREKEEALFGQAKRFAQENDPQNLQQADKLFAEVVQANGPRRADAERLEKETQARLELIKRENATRQMADLEAAGRESIRRGDLEGAQRNVNEIRQLGGDATVLSAEIGQAQAAQTKLAQEQREFQGALQAYNNVAGNDKAALERSRNVFQAIVHDNGSQANNAQKYLAEISKKLDVLNAPPPPPVRPQPKVNASDEPAVRQVVQQFFQAFEQKNLKTMARVWPRIPKERYDGYKRSFEDASAISIHIVSDRITISPDGIATYSAEVEQTYTRKDNQKSRNVEQSWAFRLAKINEAWIVTEVQ